MEEVILHDILLRPYTSIMTGGTARYYAQPKGYDELAALLRWSSEQRIPLTVIGGGTNILVSDTMIDGLVIHLRDFRRASIRGCLLSVKSGDSVDRAVTIASEFGLSGLEYYSGLPGTVGGAVYGNAGCFGHEISECIEWVEHMDHQGVTHTVFAEDLEFEYRSSPFKQMPVIITEIGFRLQPKNSVQIQEDAKAFRQRRRERGHYRHPSMGSVFKNPLGHQLSAGRLIDSSGLSGYSIGGASVAEHHANFIINKDKDATADDIHRLIEYIRERVQETHGVLLEPEIQYIGDWDR